MALQKVLFDPRHPPRISQSGELTALRAAGGFSYSRRSLMTLAVNDYVEIANALCELSTLDTLGNCDSFKKDETRRQFGASSRQAGNYSRLVSQDKSK